MARVLVTGASGFIGTALVDALARRGDAVAALDLRSSPRLDALVERHANLAFLQGDVCEWPQLAQAIKAHRPDAVIHLAAIVGVINSLASPLATMRVNVEGSLNVMEAMRLLEVPRLINLSTEEVYGPFTAPRIDESHPCRPRQPYGISKYAVEQLGRDFARNHGMEVVHLRTCWVYGPGLPRPRVPKILIDAAVAGRRLHLAAGGDFRVDHVYIDDLVDGILKALDKPEHAFDVYHIATGEAPSLLEIVAILKELEPAADLAVGPGEYAFADGVEAVRKGALDIARARAELGYTPRHPIRAGLQAYLAWRRHHPV
jgi:UDP-glucose 4-epimerase